MERDLEVDNLIEELDTLSNSFKFQNTSYDKTKLKANLNQEDFEKYIIVNKKTKIYGIICFIVLLIRFILPLSIGIALWKTGSLTGISTIIFIIGYLVYIFKVSVFVKRKKLKKGQLIIFYLVLISYLSIFTLAYYERQNYLLELTICLVVVLLCGYLYNVFSPKYIKNKNEKDTILLNQKLKDEDLLLKNKNQRIDEIKNQLYEKDVVYCNQNQLNSFINMNGFGDCCPICEEKLVVDNNYIVNYTARQPVETDAILKNGIVLNRELATSITYKDCEKTFPATKYHCPHCDYNFYISKVSFYSNENIYEKDFGGYGHTRTGEVKKKISLIKLEQGKLYPPVVNNWKNKISGNSYKFYDDFTKSSFDTHNSKGTTN